MSKLLFISFALLTCFTIIGKFQNAKQSTQAAADINPCDKPMSQMESNQCYAAQFQKADAHLNTVYKKLIVSMESELATARKGSDPDYIAYSEKQMQKLKAAELAWINYRDLHCAAAKHQTEPGTISPMRWSICMTTVTNHRIEEIKDAYEIGDKKLE